MRALWLLAMFSPSAALADVLDVTEKDLEVRLWTAIDLLEDPSAALTIEQVVEPETAARFQPYRQGHAPVFGLTRSAIWARLALRTAGDTCPKCRSEIRSSAR